MATKKKRAVKKRKINKSQAVRDYLATSPKAGPKEVCDALAKKGIKVSPAQVSNVKSAKRKKKGVKRVKRAKGASAGATVNVKDLVSAKDFAARVGGVENAKSLISTLDKLGG